MSLFLALLLAVLALQNQEPMEIELFFWRVFVPKILVILGSAFAGGLAVFLAGLFRRFGHQAAGGEKTGDHPEGRLRQAAEKEGRGEDGR